MKRIKVLNIILQCFCLSLLLNAGQAVDEKTVTMSEKYVFDDSFQRGDVGRGQTEECKFEKNPEVKKYPEFKSKKPAFGCLSIVSDISDEDTRETIKKKTGSKFFFAFDNSEGKDDTYDKLYIDLNMDLDLSNDEPVSLKEKQLEKEKALYGGELLQNAVFNTISVKVNNEGAFTGDIELIPRIILYKNHITSNFVVAKVMAGEMEIEGNKISAVLNQNYRITGRYDVPGINLDLNVNGQKLYWWGADSINATHKFGEKLYRFKTTPDGKTLTAYQYTGPTGEFVFGKGGRDVKKVSGRGSIRSLKTSASLGDEPNISGKSNDADKFIVPEDDYTAAYIHIKFDDLTVGLSNNYHSEGRALSTDGRKTVYGFHVTKDKPFVFDLSEKPKVLFASPMLAQNFKPGETVSVKAVLIDPKLDLMIRDLEDYSKDENDKKDKSGASAPNAVLNPPGKSLDPKVTILNSEGTIVASGTMPFG